MRECEGEAVAGRSTVPGAPSALSSSRGSLLMGASSIWFPYPTSLVTAKLKRDLQACVADTRALLTRQVPQTRQIIRKLIESPLRCEVYEEGGQRGYRVTGQGNYPHLLRSPAAPLWVVSPTGFEPVLPA